MPIFPVFRLNIGKNTSKSFLKKSIDRKKNSSSNVVSYAKIIQKNACASLLQFAVVTMPHLPHVNGTIAKRGVKFAIFPQLFALMWEGNGIFQPHGIE